MTPNRNEVRGEQRAIAEKVNPQADMVWMINDVAMSQLKAARGSRALCN